MKRIIPSPPGLELFRCEMKAGTPITDPLNNDPLNNAPRLDPAREVPAYAKHYKRK